MKRLPVFALLCAILFLPSVSRAQDHWAPYRFLVGDWKGGGGGQPGQAAGTFTFATELQGSVLVRRARAVVKGADGREAVHEDLMVVHSPSAHGAARASYYDTEGHVIEYRASFTPDGKSLAFISDPAPSSPRFRLTYKRLSNTSVSVKFEIAPPGKRDEFRTYVEGTAEKVAFRANHKP